MWDVIGLARCAVNGEKPDPEKIRAMDLSRVYQAADYHKMSAVVAAALESAGVREPAFEQALAFSIRKNITLDHDLQRLSRELDSQGIWHLPLKGAVMKDYYPKLGMRQMGDYDILFDPTRAEAVRDILTGMGYRVGEFGRGCHDLYLKDPAFAFEMHRMLFDPPAPTVIIRYYKNVKNRLIQDGNSGFRFRFSAEDFYVYMLAHEYKHYTAAGIGLRANLDLYVYCKRFDTMIDRAYITRELEKLGLTEFERESRKLAFALFGSGELTDEGRAILENHFASGTYGSEKNRVDRKLKQFGDDRKALLRYVWGRIFIPMDAVEEGFPFFWKYKILLPFLPPYRMLRGVALHRPRIRAELKALVRHGRNGSE